MNINESAQETAGRYKEVFLGLKEQQLANVPGIIDGEYRIEFVGIHKKLYNDQHNYNGYHLYWRLRPLDGEPLECKHLVLHHFLYATL